MPPQQTLCEQGSMCVHTYFNGEDTYIILLLQFHFAFGVMHQVYHVRTSVILLQDSFCHCLNALPVFFNSVILV